MSVCCVVKVVSHHGVKLTVFRVVEKQCIPSSGVFVRLLCCLCVV